MVVIKPTLPCDSVPADVINPFITEHFRVESDGYSCIRETQLGAVKAEQNLINNPEIVEGGEDGKWYKGTINLETGSGVVIETPALGYFSQHHRHHWLLVCADAARATYDPELEPLEPFKK